MIPGGKNISLSALCRIFRSFSPFYLSHHPNCRHYRDDVIKIGGKNICGGCFFLYFGLIVTIPPLILLGVYGFLSPLRLAMVGSFMIMPTLARTFMRFRSVFLRRCVKIFTGAGVLLLAAIPIIAGGSLWLRYLYLLSLVTMLAMIRYLQAANFRNICFRCIYHGDFSRCTGFREVAERLRKNGCDPSRILKKRNF